MEEDDEIPKKRKGSLKNKGNRSDVPMWKTRMVLKDTVHSIECHSIGVN